MGARILRVQKQAGVRAEEARQLAIEHDQASAAYLKRLFGIQWDDPALYHITINTGKWELRVAAQIIVDLVGRWQAEPMS
jgi:cytidylate kinase